MSSENKHAYKRGFWREHSDAAWKSSGLTQAEYCQQQGISYQSFVYQHNRMACKAQRTSGMSFLEAKPEKDLQLGISRDIFFSNPYIHMNNVIIFTLFPLIM